MGGISPITMANYAIGQPRSPFLGNTTVLIDSDTGVNLESK